MIRRLFESVLRTVKAENRDVLEEVCTRGGILFATNVYREEKVCTMGEREEPLVTRLPVCLFPLYP